VEDLGTPAVIEQTGRRVQVVYLTLLLGNTLAASLIWGINTIFLLDAGLSNLEAFAANAFFTAGMVLFEVPTGIVADSRGRRLSYLLGTATLVASTLLYLVLWWLQGPFWAWAVTSALLGLGFTFFSGAVEAWLVDALAATGYTGTLEAVLGRGQVVTGVAMLAGSVGGGVLAQVTNLGVPFALRSAILAVMFVVAAVYMKDLGFVPSRSGSAWQDMKGILATSVDAGLRERRVRWLMLSAPFMGGVTIYVFYALQPYLLELYGDERAYSVAGLVAAAFAGAQIAGGLAAPRVRTVFHRRTTALIVGSLVGTVSLALIGLLPNLWVVLALVLAWGFVFAAISPIQQAYLNDLIPSQQRATVLSFQSLMESVGGVVAQPVLGRTADVWGYGPSFLVSSAVSLLAVPFLVLARRERAPADTAVAPVAAR
jgi:MFS family permease